jgi:hypothetical protein
MIDSQITFQGIECPDLRRQIKELVDDLTQFVPSDSAVRVTFRKIRGRFLADFKVASESAYMTAMDQANVLGELLDKVKSKVMGQIIDWRTHRFAS